MNNMDYFGIGFVIGALSGSVASYFVVKKKLEEYADEEIERYKEYTKEKIQHIKETVNALDEDPIKEPEPEEVQEEKYSKVGKAIADTYNNVFPKKSKDKEGEKMGVIQPVTKMDHQIRKDHPGIDEITEDFFGTEDDYTACSLDYIFEDDELYFGYGTDNQELAEEHYGMTRNDIISEFWRWAPDYVDNEEEGVGSFYVRNNNMKTDFEVIVHMGVEEEEDD